MKVLLCVHGYPPEQLGGTERSAQQLARGLVARGHEVVVVAGSLEVASEPGLRVSEASDGDVRVLRLHRPDLYFDHWQKSRSVRVAQELRRILQEEQPDLLHVLHWLRLSRDLVVTAARAGVPAVVSLNDHWVGCPLTFRVDPRTRASCEQPLSALGCSSCAGSLPPHTPWVPREAAMMELAQREQQLARELRLARVVLAPTRAHAARIARLAPELGLGDVELAPPAAPPLLTSDARTSALEGELRFLSFGSLSELKGLDLLFEAFAAPGVAGRARLLLAGREGQPGILADLSARFPSAAVTHLGEYDGSGLADEAHPLRRAARQSDAFVSATRAPESFGLVLDESRALGLPAVLPRLGAFAERATEGEGATFFEAGSADALAARLRELLEDSTQVAALRARLAEPVREEEVLSAHLEAYTACVAAGAPQPEEAGVDEWYEERLALFAEEEWDRALSTASAEQLGFEE